MWSRVSRLQFAAAKEVGTRIPDVGDDQGVRQAQGQRQGRPHVPQARPTPGLVADRLIHLLEPPRCAFHHPCKKFIVTPEDPVGGLKGELEEHGEGHAAGDLAGRMPADPVGDREPVAGRVILLGGFPGGEAGEDRAEVAAEPDDVEVVLVLRPHPAGVRAAADLHVKNRRGGRSWEKRREVRIRVVHLIAGHRSAPVRHHWTYMG